MANTHQLHTGYCDKTKVSNPRQCSHEDKGAFKPPWRWNALRSEDELAARCQQLCLACERCRFISFSLEQRDCSWYHECDTERLRTDVAGFRTEAATSMNQTKIAWVDLPAPRLLLFYHSHKAAGTTMTGWLGRMLRQGLLDGHVIFQAAQCYLCGQFGELLRCAPGCDEYARARRLGKPSVFEGGAWARTRVSVELHTPAGQQLLFQTVLPHLAALRRRYTDHGGEVVLVTTAREPLSWIFSVWRMWPPRRRAGKAEPLSLAMPFPRWALQMRGAQAAQFVLLNTREEPQRVVECHAAPEQCAPQSTPTPGGATHRRGAAAHAPRLRSAIRFQPSVHSLLGCEVLPAALRALSPFDLVATTACLGSLVRGLEARLGLRSGRSPPLIAHRPLGAPPPNSLLYNQSQAWSWANLSAEERRSLRNITRCDRRFYELAESRAQELPGGCTRSGTIEW